MIFAEIIGERVEVSYSDLPGLTYRTNMCALICDVASVPYQRGESSRWFAGTHRLPLAEVNGRPC